MFPNTIIKLHRKEPVMMNVLDKIYEILGPNYGDVMDYLSDKERSDKS